MTPEEASDVRGFFESRSDHLTHGRDGIRRFEYWANDRMSVDPAFHTKLAEGARSVLREGNAQLACAALQSLAVAGSLDDCELIAHYALSPSSAVAEDAQVCLKHLQRRFKTLAQLLNEVGDQESFTAFAYALLDDRERNEPPRDGYMESRSDRRREQWQCNSISDYVARALSYFVGGGQGWEQLTWQDIAAFFDSGRTSDEPITGRSSRGAGLLGEVTTHDSFVAFVLTLIEERRRAESIEATRRDKPAWEVEAAEGWQNSLISDFLGIAMLYFDINGAAIPEPSWADLADSLFQGKICE